MSYLGARAQLHVGTRGRTPPPAPFALAQALSQIEVKLTDGSDGAPGCFSLTFQVGEGLSRSFLLNSYVLKPGNRARITCLLNGEPTILMDGYVTTSNYKATAKNTGTMIVTGEDLRTKMDLAQLPISYPYMPDALIALLTLARYLRIGLVPMVVPTPSALMPPDLNKTPQQEMTDLEWIKLLAARNNCLFNIVPGPVGGMSLGYWGPKIPVGKSQGTLHGESGPAANVEWGEGFDYSPMKANFYYGMAFLEKLSFPVVIPPLPKALGSIQSPLSVSDFNPASMISNPLSLLEKISNIDLPLKRFDYRGESLPKAMLDAAALMWESTSSAAEVKGKVDTLRLGKLLRPGGLVEVDGAGTKNDGAYYVQAVAYSMSVGGKDGAFTQDFTLKREGPMLAL